MWGGWSKDAGWLEQEQRCGVAGAKMSKDEGWLEQRCGLAGIRTKMQGSWNRDAG